MKLRTGLIATAVIGLASAAYADVLCKSNGSGALSLRAGPGCKGDEQRVEGDVTSIGLKAAPSPARPFSCLMRRGDPRNLGSTGRHKVAELCASGEFCVAWMRGEGTFAPEAGPRTDTCASPIFVPTDTYALCCKSE